MMALHEYANKDHLIYTLRDHSSHEPNKQIKWDLGWNVNNVMLLKKLQAQINKYKNIISTDRPWVHDRNSQVMGTSNVNQLGPAT